MPAPAGAIVVLLPIYLHLSVVQMPQGRALVPLFIAYVLLVAFLMASRIPHFSGKQMGAGAARIFLVVMLGVVAGILLLASYPAEVLVLLTLLYLGLIPLALRRFQALQAADEAAAAAAGSRGGNARCAGLGASPEALSGWIARRDFRWPRF